MPNRRRWPGHDGGVPARRKKAEKGIVPAAAKWQTHAPKDPFDRPGLRADEQEAAIQELARISVFERLQKDELETLAALTKRNKYPRGTAVFFQDDPSDALYLVISGSAKVYQTSEDGKERILTILKPGDVVGELAMVEGQARSASVQALEDSELLVLTRQDFRSFCDGHPSVLWELLETFAARLRRMNEDILDLSFRDVPYRVLRVLSELVQSHSEPTAEGSRIAVPLTVRDLSSLVGSNPDTVGRLLDRYETDGLVRRDGRSWIVPDPRALTRALEYAAQ